MATGVDLADRTIKEYRILLIGKTGAGKSATGNSILGHLAFETALGLASKTTRTQMAESTVSGRRLVIVDTPGFYDTDRGNDFIVQEVVKMFGFLTPGLHALIFVMSPERFTKECVQTKQLFFKVFGAGIAKYTIILITGADRILAKGGSIKKFITNSTPEFMSFSKVCGNRIITFDNNAKGEFMTQQVNDLIAMIDSIQSKVGNKCFSNVHFKTMLLYKKFRRTQGPQNIKRARKTLCKKIKERYGVERKFVWGPEYREQTKPEMDKKALSSIALATRNETDVKDSESSASSMDDEFNDESEDGDIEEIPLEDREAMRVDKTYMERFIDFFTQLLRPVFSSMFKTDK